jgi:hypothetical protein
MKNKLPKTVIKHVRTITTYYLTDNTDVEMKGELQSYLAELPLPDSYGDGDYFGEVRLDVMAISNDCTECDKLEYIPEAKIADELDNNGINSEYAIESWNEKLKSRKWLDMVNERKKNNQLGFGNDITKQQKGTK